MQIEVPLSRNKRVLVSIQISAEDICLCLRVIFHIYDFLHIKVAPIFLTLFFPLISDINSDLKTSRLFICKRAFTIRVDLNLIKVVLEHQ
jgi:hypothetical protein